MDTQPNTQTGPPTLRVLTFRKPRPKRGQIRKPSRNELGAAAFKRDIDTLGQRNGVSRAATELGDTVRATAQMLGCLAKENMPTAAALPGLAKVLDHCAIRLARIALASYKMKPGRKTETGGKRTCR